MSRGKRPKSLLVLALLLILVVAFPACAPADLASLPRPAAAAVSAPRLPPGPPHPEAVKSLQEGERYLKARKFDPAIEAFQRALALYPSSPEAYRGLGAAYLALRQFDEAIDALQRGIQVDPSRVGLHLALGQAYTKKGFAIDPRCGSPHAGIGASPGTKDDKALRQQWIKKSNDLYHQAMAAFQSALELDPHNVAAHDGLQYACYRQGQYQEGVAWARRAVELSPNDAGLYIGLGNNYRHVDPGLALQAYDRALQLNPKNSHVYKLIWETYAANKDWEGAIARLKPVVEANPKNLVATMYLGVSYARQGDLDSGLRYLEQAVAIDPKCGEAYGFAAAIYKKKGDLAKAEDYARRAEWYKPK